MFLIMKKSLLFCFVLTLFLDLRPFAQELKSVISFDQKEFNFGTFRESDGMVVHDFIFTNVGKVPLILRDVKASCGCTTPEWTKEPILPGRTGSIRVSFNPKNRPGSFSKTIQVSSNAEVPVVTLAIQGVVIPVDKVEDVYKFSIGPVRIQTIYAAFGEIYKGAKGNYSIRVMNTSHDKPAELNFKQLPPYLKATMVPARIEPQQEGRIDLEYNSSLQNGWDYAVDRVDLLVNGEVFPNNRISITANIRENFQNLTAEDMSKAPVVEFDHTSFDFGTILQDKPVEHVFVLTNTGKSALIIRKVSASCGCTAVQPEKTTVAPGEKTVIRAVFNPAGRDGNQKKAITVITNDPRRSKTILWINGIVTKSEDSHLNP
jgi:hypothetical protein